MFQKKLIFHLANGRLPQSAGGKALNLRLLMNNGIHIPVTDVCTREAYQRYIDNDVSLVAALQEELKQLLKPGKTYAVRSSANIEDGAERSFAGQFKSALNVPGRMDDVLQAIWSVWSSVQAPAVKAYRERNNLSARDLAMAVIIQEMVTPVYSGVALSKNPVTGGDEVVVEAVSGLGTQLAQSGRTPTAGSISGATGSKNRVRAGCLTAWSMKSSPRRGKSRLHCVTRSTWSGSGAASGCIGCRPEKLPA